MLGSEWRCLCLSFLQVSGTKGQHGEGVATGARGLQLVISLVFPLKLLLLTFFSL